MPSLKMKTKQSLGVCQTSSVICKKPRSDVTVFPAMEAQKNQDDCMFSSDKVHAKETNEAVLDQQQWNFQFQNHDSKMDSGTAVKRDSTHNCTDDLETIFSPALDPIGICHMPNVDENLDYRTCKMPDFSISNMITSCLPFDGNAIDLKIESFPDYRCVEPSMFFDVAEECLLLPLVEDIAKSNGVETIENLVDDGLYSAITQIRTYNQECDPISDADQPDNFDPQFFIRNLPELSEFQPCKDSQRSKSVTLVLDLDETLVHSTLERCDDADFTFTVSFNMEEHTVYVKKRPHLHTFLERVAEMFEVFIFTASQSIYAEKLLDILDSAEDKKLISRRVFRESCVFTDGAYIKDLTVLGVDLAKVAIIDNTPQVFSLQINNGIPIKSWFSDPSDTVLLSLLPFLETLAEADDVRPIIARRFGNIE